MTYLEEMTNLLSKVDAACVFARSKTMQRLLEDLEPPNETKMTIVAVIMFSAVAVVIAAGVFLGLSAETIGVLVPSALFAVFMTDILVKVSQIQRYEKQAQEAGVCVIKGADKPATAVTKMRIIDAYEHWNFPQEQLTMLKSLAQREDIPAGWWRSAAQLIDRYRKAHLESRRQEKFNEEALHAEKRLASLLCVSAAPLEDVAILKDEPHKDATRLLV